LPRQKKRQKKKVGTKVVSRQAYFCGDKTFVATKIILMAAPANDTCAQ